jgi:hypothetical protein
MMGTIKNGTVSTWASFAKHLRKYGKRHFWKRERKAAQRTSKGGQG